MKLLVKCDLENVIIKKCLKYSRTDGVFYNGIFYNSVFWVYNRVYHPLSLLFLGQGFYNFKTRKLSISIWTVFKQFDIFLLDCFLLVKRPKNLLIFVIFYFR